MTTYVHLQNINRVNKKVRKGETTIVTTNAKTDLIVLREVLFDTVYTSFRVYNPT